MTQEEKAQAYDEAIEKLRSLHDDYDNVSTLIDIKEELENIFPELKESEDEKIRKAIYNCVKWFGFDSCFFKYVSQEECLAWLEKQGENTYNKELLELLHKVICRFINDPDIPYSDREKVSMKVLPYVERLEKQGEQMPVDKVEPKFHVGDIVKRKDNPHLTYILKRFTDDGDYEFHAIGKDGHEGCTCFSIVKYQDEWELVEQKPAWSGEDEAVLDALIRRLEGEDVYVSPHSAAECLKSLKERYSWKPSDEQLEALANALSLANNCGEESAFDLRTLHKQLKKLKG